MRCACQANAAPEAPKVRFSAKLHHLGFVMWRRRDHLNVFSPRVCGSFRQDADGRCQVDLTMRLHRFHRMLMLSVYICWAICLTTLFLVAHHAELLWTIALIPLPLLVAGSIAFRIDARRRARKIMLMARGQSLRMAEDKS